MDESTPLIITQLPAATESTSIVYLPHKIRKGFNSHRLSEAEPFDDLDSHVFLILKRVVFSQNFDILADSQSSAENSRQSVEISEGGIRVQLSDMNNERSSTVTLRCGNGHLAVHGSAERMLDFSLSSDQGRDDVLSDHVNESCSISKEAAHYYLNKRFYVEL